MDALGYQQLLGVKLTSTTSPQLRAQAQTAQACRDFEALFIEQVFKEMRKSLRADPALAPLGNAFYTDMLYQNYAHELAQRSSAGLGESLFRQSLDLQHAVNQYGAATPAPSSVKEQA